MNYCSSLKTIFIVCFGVILFIVSHSSISSPITDYKLSIGNIFEVVPNGKDTWDLKLMNTVHIDPTKDWIEHASAKLMDAVYRDPTKDWIEHASAMIIFMNRLPEKKIQIISLGKYHSDLFLIIGKDTSADKKWGQMVLRLNTEVDERDERKIFGTCFKNAFQEETKAEENPIPDIRLENDLLLAANIMSNWMNYNMKKMKVNRGKIGESEVDKVNERKIVAPFIKKAFQKVTETKYVPSQRTVDCEMFHGNIGCDDPIRKLSKGNAPELARNIMREWLQYNVECGKGITWEYSGNPILPLDSELISDLTAEGIDDFIESKGMKDVVFDITLLDRLSSFLIIQQLPYYFFGNYNGENLSISSRQCIWPLLYLTPDGSLIPKPAEAEYNVQISGRLAKVRTHDDPKYNSMNVWRNDTVADHLSNPRVHGYYRLTQMANVNDFFEIQKGYFRHNILNIKKLKKLINDIDMTKKESDILERSQKLAYKQTSKKYRGASKRIARPYNQRMSSCVEK